MLGSRRKKRVSSEQAEKKITDQRWQSFFFNTNSIPSPSSGQTNIKNCMIHTSKELSTPPSPHPPSFLIWLGLIVLLDLVLLIHVIQDLTGSSKNYITSSITYSKELHTRKERIFVRNLYILWQLRGYKSLNLQLEIQRGDIGASFFVAGTYICVDCGKEKAKLWLELFWDTKKYLEQL